MNPQLELVREREKDVVSFITGIDYETPHFHSNLEIHYTLENNFTAIINGKKHNLSKGQVVVINSYDIHSTKGINTLCVIIPYTFLTGLENYKKTNPLNQCVFTDTNGELENILQQLTNTDLHILKKKSLIYEFFANLYTIYEKEHKTISDNKSFSYPLMRDIIEYVNQNYSQKITLEDIVEKFNYSKSHVSHTINKYLDCNLNTYVNIVRLKNFVEKMKDEPESKIITVAYDCGFDSLQTFYRNFKSFYKCTPLDFIKNLKTNLD